ncbi:hypothetical protein KCP73_25865 [Salmonella enterica subsp. enterica]|nr:hypothetical protein KCP73_25865 [Salmonella enterica subsp. enterica]
MPVGQQRLFLRYRGNVFNVRLLDAFRLKHRWGTGGSSGFDSRAGTSNAM